MAKRKWLCFSTAVGILFLLLQPAPARGAGMALKLYGGFSLVRGGDLNEGLEGMMNGWRALSIADGWTSSGEYSPLQNSLEGGADFILLFSPVVGITLGGGYLQSLPHRSEYFVTRAALSATISGEPEMKSIPLRAGLYFSIPMGSAVNFSLRGAAEFHLARIRADFRIGDSGGFIAANSTANATGFGFCGGIGFEVNFSPNLAFVLEGQGRYARIPNFKGTAEFFFTVPISSEDGFLYIYEEDGYPGIVIQDAEPAGPGVTDVRKAVIDFSGFSAFGGFLFRF